MLDDGVKGAGRDESEVRVADISMHLLEAIERASRRLPLPLRRSKTDQSH